MYETKSFPGGGVACTLCFWSCHPLSLLSRSVSLFRLLLLASGLLVVIVTVGLLLASVGCLVLTGEVWLDFVDPGTFVVAWPIGPSGSRFRACSLSASPVSFAF